MNPPSEQLTQPLLSIVDTNTQADEGNEQLGQSQLSPIQNDLTSPIIHFHASIRDMARLLQIQLFGPRSVIGDTTAL